MPFSYYSRLSARNQALYRASDGVREIRLPQPERLVPLGETLRRALTLEDRRAVAAAARALADALLGQLKVAPLAVKVLAVRPSSGWGELHGLYTASEEAPAEIRLWMRTVQHKQVVAFRTFLRTLLHEIGHHLDYRYLKLRDSYHTEGFFRRESSLFRQIVPSGSEAVRADRRKTARVEAAGPPKVAAPRAARGRPSPAVSSPTPKGSTPRRPRATAPRPVGAAEAVETSGPVQGRLIFDPADET
jgi:hypothetical protein